MATIFTNIKERILYITDFKKISKEKFFSDLGVTYGNFKGEAKKKALSSDVLAKIVTIFPDINPNWLLTGKEPMLLDDKSKSLVVSDYSNEKRYPLVYPKAVGGFSGSDFKIEERDIKEYYVVPKFKHKKIDFMIEVEGSSMYPKYNSGDIVACKIINEERFIQWNKTHVIASKDQGLLIKRIKKGPEGTLTMISDNENYDPFDVPTDDIDGVALVVGVIRLE